MKALAWDFMTGSDLTNFWKGDMLSVDGDADADAETRI